METHEAMDSVKRWVFYELLTGARFLNTFRDVVSVFDPATVAWVRRELEGVVNALDGDARLRRTDERERARCALEMLAVAERT